MKYMFLNMNLVYSAESGGQVRRSARQFHMML